MRFEANHNSVDTATRGRYISKLAENYREQIRLGEAV